MPTTGWRPAAFTADGARVLALRVDGRDVPNRSSRTPAPLTLSVWEAGNPAKLIRSLDGEYDWITGVSFSPDGSCVAVAFGTQQAPAAVWDIQSGKQHCVLGSDLGELSFSPASGQILVSMAGMKAATLDAETCNERVRLDGQVGFVDTLTFSPDASRVLGTCWPQDPGDDFTCTWDARTGEQLLDSED